MIEKLASRILIICTVTNTCNQTCKHCVTGADTKNRKELNYEVIQSLLVTLKKMDQDFMISFVGGEATVWSHFFPMIQQKEFQNIPFKMLYTNATAITSGDIDLIREAGFFEVRVSIDSDRKEEHDDLRGEGTFDRTITCVRDMIRKGISVTSATVMKKNNIGRLDDIIAFAKELGISVMHFLPFYMSGRGILQKTLAVDEQDKAFIRVKIRTKYADRQRHSYAVCGDGTAYFKIDPEGNCILQWKREKCPLGNLNTESFDVLYRRVVKERNLRVVDCRTCSCYGDPVLCENMHIYCMDDIDNRGKD